MRFFETHRSFETFKYILIHGLFLQEKKDHYKPKGPFFLYIVANSFLVPSYLTATVLLGKQCKVAFSSIFNSRRDTIAINYPSAVRYTGFVIFYVFRYIYYLQKIL